MIKLLKKSDIDAKKAQERHLEIEEGKRLARTVDELRQLKAQEEAAFEAWRVSTLKGIQADITAATQELESIKVSVREHEKRLKDTLKPSDAIWNEIKDVRAEVEKERAEMARDRTTLFQGISLNIQRERENEVEAGRVANEKHLATEARVDAARDRDSAQKELREVREKSVTMNAALDLKEKELSRKQRDLETDRKAIEETQKRIDKYESDLQKREIALKDGWKTLMNTQKEIHG
jgi:chromosome segregation ATPase